MFRSNTAIKNLGCWWIPLCPTPRRSRTTSDHSILPSCSQRLAHASRMYYHPHRLCCVSPALNAFPGVLSARVIELTPLNPFKIKERSTMPAAHLGCSIIPTWFRIPKRRKDTNKYYLWSQLASDSKIRKQSNNFCSSNLKIVYTRNLNLCS